MPGCYLRIAGTEFDPDSFLATASLIPASVWHVGDPLAKSGPSASRFREWAGFACDVSDADGDLEQQIDDAIAFLTQHRDDLLLLNADSTIEDRRLDFGFDSRLGDVAVQGEWLPVDFMRLAADLNIDVALSLYPAS